MYSILNHNKEIVAERKTLKAARRLVDKPEFFGYTIQYSKDELQKHTTPFTGTKPVFEGGIFSEWESGLKRTIARSVEEAVETEESVIDEH